MMIPIFNIIYENTADTYPLDTFIDVDIYDKVFSGNKIVGKPEAVIVTDTYNHPLFPISIPRIDTANIRLKAIYDQLKANYMSFDFTFFPWHYLVKLSDIGYVIYNTRPINIMFPVTSDIAIEYLEANKRLTDDLKKILNSVEIANSIHVTIVGDTNSDIYTRPLYRLIKEMCILPIYQYSRIGRSLNNFVTFINIGKKFNKSMVVKA